MSFWTLDIYLCYYILKIIVSSLKSVGSGRYERHGFSQPVGITNQEQRSGGGGGAIILLTINIIITICA